MPRQLLVLIDAHALIHRAYHALPPMSTSKGQPTNAVYGFVAMLLKVFTLLKPTHVVAAFDTKGPTHRSEAFADYKAHRKAAPDDLIAQFDVVRRVVRAFNIPVLEKSGFEADDIIGTLVHRLNDSLKKVIVTGDADAFQLISDMTHVLMLRRGATDTVLYNEESFREKYGFAPPLLVDYKGLRGDPSDNIPGVAGIGEKTAQELIKTYGPIENIFGQFDKLPERLQKKLKGKKKEALFSRKLSQLKTDIPLDFDLKDAELHDYDQQAVHEIFAELEFKSFLSKLPKSSRAGIQGALFATPDVSESVELPENYHLVKTKKDQAALQKLLSKQEVIAFDTETDYLSARTAPLVGISLAAEVKGKTEAWYVPIDRAGIREWKELLENKKVGKVGHNLKYDMEVLAQSGIRLGPIVFDSMIGSYLLNPGARQHNLDTLALQELGKMAIPITSLIGSGKDQKKMSAVPLPVLTRYSAEDADFSLQLYRKLLPRIKEEGLTRILTEFELPLIEVLAAMELTGIRLDTAYLKKLEKKLTKRLIELQEEIWKHAGTHFNINSTKQLRAILFEKLALTTKGISRKQSGFSTAAAELGKLRGLHPIIEDLEEYRELSKLLNTYVSALPVLVDKKTSRLYGSFNQTVAATGRLSSTDPNLQNIPIRTDLGTEIRAAFVADKGKKLVKADYSQLELRLAAHIAQDKKMIAAFRAGEDIHKATAAWVYGIKPEEVTTAQRRVAKTLNFGVLYGMGPKKFARESKLSQEEAQDFIDRYRAQYAGVTKLFNETIAHAQQFGYVETLFGRKRYVPEINASSMVIRAQAERIAFNFPMQGTEADILKKAMIELQAVIQKDFPEVKLVLTVHDELVAEAPAKEAVAFAKVMKKTMENVYTLDVPLEVDVAIGDTWKDMELVH